MATETVALTPKLKALVFTFMWLKYCIWNAFCVKDFDAEQEHVCSDCEHSVKFVVLKWHVTHVLSTTAGHDCQCSWTFQHLEYTTHTHFKYSCDQIRQPTYIKRFKCSNKVWNLNSIRDFWTSGTRRNVPRRWLVSSCWDKKQTRVFVQNTVDYPPPSPPPPKKKKKT